MYKSERSFSHMKTNNEFSACSSVVELAHGLSLFGVAHVSTLGGILPVPVLVQNLRDYVTMYSKGSLACRQI